MIYTGKKEAIINNIIIIVNYHSVQFYTGGIVHPERSSCNPNDMNHAVLLVGYGGNVLLCTHDDILMICNDLLGEIVLLYLKVMFLFFWDFY